MATKKKKRKTEDENREFKVEWTETFAFVQNSNGHPTCLICKKKFAHNKKSNLERHLTNKHASFNSQYPVGDARKKAVEELLKSQEASTFVFNNLQSSSNRASFAVSQEIAKRGKPYTDGEYIKSCFIEASEELFRDFKNKADILKKIKELPLSAKIMKDRVSLITELNKKKMEDLRSSQSSNVGEDATTASTSTTIVSANILIACTGSVAALKIPELVQAIIDRYNGNHLVAVCASSLDISVLFRRYCKFPDSLDIIESIKVIATKNSMHFFKRADLPNTVQLITDEDEWSAWSVRGDPVLHIELVKWADLLVIAPLDANTLAKMSQGICDNLLTCVTRAWIMSKPLLFCPAMNTRMWEHPLTAPQVQILKSFGHTEVACIAKTLMCGDTGLGAMAEVSTIVQCVHMELFKKEWKS